ncbi:hypothetical protein [Desulfosporosinus hippei]|uniref:hypothetical protein n=1 Tax=Desulfosporosinus hippei TaxID=569859 RepID=UPI00115FA067|nr:hypothetical protein [Desulfosporosinus hippei]
MDRIRPVLRVYYRKTFLGIFRVAIHAATKAAPSEDKKLKDCLPNTLKISAKPYHSPKVLLTLPTNWLEERF